MEEAEEEEAVAAGEGRGRLRQDLEPLKQANCLVVRFTNTVRTVIAANWKLATVDQGARLDGRWRSIASCQCRLYQKETATEGMKHDRGGGCLFSRWGQIFIPEAGFFVLQPIRLD